MALQQAGKTGNSLLFVPWSLQGHRGWETSSGYLQEPGSGAQTAFDVPNLKTGWGQCFHCRHLLWQERWLAESWSSAGTMLGSFVPLFTAEDAPAWPALSWQDEYGARSQVSMGALRFPGREGGPAIQCSLQRLPGPPGPE